MFVAFAVVLCAWAAWGQALFVVRTRNRLLPDALFRIRVFGTIAAIDLVPLGFMAFRPSESGLGLLMVSWVAVAPFSYGVALAVSRYRWRTRATNTEPEVFTTWTDLKAGLPQATVLAAVSILVAGGLASGWNIDPFLAGLIGVFVALVGFWLYLRRARFR